jgi:hypothetical protein
VHREDKRQNIDDKFSYGKQSLAAVLFLEDGLFFKKLKSSMAGAFLTFIIKMELKLVCQ